MEKAWRDLNREIENKNDHKLGSEFQSIKDELSTMSKTASMDTSIRKQKLESLHKDLHSVGKAAEKDNLDVHLKLLTQASERTEQNMDSEHKRMFGVSIAVVAFVLVSGLLLYNKFRLWEKKHVL